jgi:hypothetical protein
MYSCYKDVSPEDGQCVFATRKLKLETIKIIYTFLDAFVGVKYMNENTIYCFRYKY